MMAAMNSDDLAKWIEWETNAKQYLCGAMLSYESFPETVDHDHCELCWARFGNSTGEIKEGYHIAANNCWICEECYSLFKDVFNWQIME